MDFAHYQSPKLLSSSPPITQVSIFGALSISGQINRENLRQTCRDYPIYLGRSAKSKIPDRLGSSRLLKTRLKSFAWLVCRVVGFSQGVNKPTTRETTHANDFVNAKSHARENLCSRGSYQQAHLCEFLENFCITRLKSRREEWGVPYQNWLIG